jgi:hypothetical protein
MVVQYKVSRHVLCHSHYQQVVPTNERQKSQEANQSNALCLAKYLDARGH